MVLVHTVSQLHNSTVYDLVRGIDAVYDTDKKVVHTNALTTWWMQ